MEHLKILYAGSIWGKNLLLNEVPSEARIEQFLAEKVDLSDLIVLDLEQWDVTGSDAEASLSISKLAETQRLFRKHAPDRLFGFYGLLPIRNYHCPQKPPYNTCHGTWRYQNDRLAAFAKSTDALFPSLYTFYEDPVGWEKYAIAQIQEARRIAPDKKIYAFLWPEYHGSNQKKRFEYVGDSYWLLQLDTVRDYADGVVIWGGWDLE